MKKRNDMLKRALAIVLVAALIGTMIISVLISAGAFGGDHDHGHAAHAEEARDVYLFEMELLEDEQALRVTQRLAFCNRTGDTLDRAMFSIYANMFRRESTVMYESADALPYGFNPGGVEFYSVKVNGQDADWAVQGDGEYFMRVDCDLAPWESCEFEFVYDVLITRNAAFLGVDNYCWRLSGFYPTLCVYDSEEGIWEGNSPMQHARYTLTTPADYRAVVTLPEMYDVAATGGEAREDNGDGTCTWTISGENIREFALTIGGAWREYSGETESGVEVRVLTADRTAGDDALEHALAAVELYEEMFGIFPAGSVDIAETDVAVGMQTFAGCVWLDRSVFSEGGDALKYHVRRALADQYFGISVYSDQVSHAWLGESVAEYATYLAYEALDGQEEFTDRMNLYFVDAINVTIPSALVMNSDAGSFTQSQFITVVRHRGAMAMHELRVSMGRDMFVDSLAAWYSRNGGGPRATESDFLETLQAVSGHDWEDFLTELIFNIEEYSQQSLDWYE